MKNSGFTLVELLITIAIMGIVLAIGSPSFKGVMRGSDMSANSSDLVSALNYARTEAIKRGNSVQLSPQSGSTWTAGLVAWVDSDGDSVWDGGEELRLWESFNSGSSIVSGNNLSRFVFKASGEVQVFNAAAVEIINSDDDLTLCDDRTGEKGRIFNILPSGAIYVDEVTCG